MVLPFTMHVTAALLYVIAVVIKISTVVGFLAPAAPLFDHSAASRLFDRHAQLTHVSARSGPLHKMATSRNNAVIAAPPLAATRRGGMDDGDNVERKSEGIEPK